MGSPEDLLRERKARMRGAFYSERARMRSLGFFQLLLKPNLPLRIRLRWLWSWLCRWLGFDDD